MIVNGPELGKIFSEDKPAAVETAEKKTIEFVECSPELNYSGKEMHFIVVNGHDLGRIYNYRTEDAYTAFIHREQNHDWTIRGCKSLDEISAAVRRIFMAMDVGYDTYRGEWFARPIS